MGRYVFRLPDVGEGTTAAEITLWHVKPGDLIAEDDLLVDVTTDKATVEIPSPVGGTVISVNGEPGQSLPVGTELVVLDVPGYEGRAGAAEPEPAAPPAGEPTSPEPAAPPPPRPSPLKGEGVREVPSASPPPSRGRVGRGGAPPAARRPGEKPLASPAVRQRARDLGVDLRFVHGSGPAGRIGHGDLDGHVADGGRPAGGGLAARHAVEQVKVIGIRRTIAERMQESKRRIPHYAYVEELDMTALEDLRQHLNAGRERERRLTLLPFLVRAIVVAVPDHPEVNARFDDDAGVVERHAAVHAGIATQTPNGLLVPVLRHAETLTLDDCAAEIARLAELARTGKPVRGDLSGSTITITSLGPIGGIATTPVINHPEVAIVGVNRMVERPVVREGRIEVRRMMNLSCSFDHRVVDGWDGARFVQRLKSLLEQPATLFMDAGHG